MTDLHYASQRIDLKDPILFMGILLDLYYLQGMMNTSGSILSRTLMMILLLYGAFAFMMIVLRKNQPIFIILLMIFLLMLSFTYIASPKYVVGTKYEAIGKISTLSQYKNSCAFILSFFIGYYVCLKRGSNFKNLCIIGLLFLLTAVIIFNYSQNYLRSHLDSEDIVNNSAYNFVAVIPFVPLFFKTFKSKIWGITSVIIILIMVMLGAKRGAIVCTITCLAFALLYYLYSSKFSIKRIFVVLLISIFAYLLIVHLYESSDFLQRRVTGTFTRGIGGRAIAYPVLLNAWLHDSTVFEFLFGKGAAATVTVWGNYGHQDWLELLTDNGLIGVMLYLAIFISIFSYIRKAKIEKYLKLTAYLCVLTWFMKSMFSMGYTSIVDAIHMILLGSIIGLNEIKKVKNS